MTNTINTPAIDLRKAGFCKNGNIKLGSQMWTFSKLYGSKVHETKYGPVQGTCSGHCQGCEGKCYVKASYRYGSVINGHAIRTLAMRQDMEGLFAHLYGQLARRKKKDIIVRLDQSGEIESAKEFFNWMLLASAHPDVKFYIYTKDYEDAILLLSRNLVPENMTILFSVWHEYGLTEYLQWQDHPSVKAFVYDDLSFDYEAHGLHIQTYCHAYDEHGKLDHEVTCERCQKCFNRIASCKVIGCYSH